jgi:hypothetical protein
MNTWTRVRVSLVGMPDIPPVRLGGGTRLAVVGAYVLASELAAASGHVRGLAAYGQVLRPAVLQSQRIGPYVLQTIRRSRGAAVGNGASHPPATAAARSSPSATHLLRRWSCCDAGGGEATRSEGCAMSTSTILAVDDDRQVSRPVRSGCRRAALRPRSCGTWLHADAAAEALSATLTQSWPRELTEHCPGP